MKKTTVTAATATKVETAHKGPKKPIDQFFAELDGQEDDGEGDAADAADEGHGKIWHILKAYIAGYERKDIVAYGYNPSTVYRQTGEYDKLRKAPATHYQGFEVFESRVQRIMRAKKLDRKKAVEYIYAKDLED
jgi:hypothetical protein